MPLSRREVVSVLAAPIHSSCPMEQLGEHLAEKSEYLRAWDTPEWHAGVCDAAERFTSALIRCYQACGCPCWTDVKLVSVGCGFVSYYNFTRRAHWTICHHELLDKWP